MPSEASFWARVDRSGDCWVWIGRRFPTGYGNPGGHAYAHRVSWELANGPIPVGMYVCHHCDNPPCVRPDHLFLGTAKDNAQDRNRKGRDAKARGWKRPLGSACDRGHFLPASDRRCRAQSCVGV